MSLRSNRHLAICCASFIVIAICIGCRDRASVAADPFVLTDLHGQPAALFREPAPPVTVAVFVRSDCPISNRYSPELRRLFETLQPRGVEFNWIYVNPRESAGGVRRHQREYDLPGRALLDPNHRLANHCGATVTPEAVVWDSKHTIIYMGRIDNLYLEVGKAQAQATTQDLAAAIAATLQGQAVATPRTKAVGCLIADLKE